MSKRMKPSCARVLQQLRLYSGGWVRGVELARPDVGGLRFGGRIHELRQLGYDIEDKPDPSGKTRVHLYRLVEAPRQLTLLEEVS